MPPGTWVDYFTGERFTGPVVRDVQVPLDHIPVLVRAGAVIPTQPPAPFTPAAPPASLILTAFPGAHGRIALYDDTGTGFGYERGEHTRTRIVQTRGNDGVTVRVDAARADFPGAPRTRNWTIRLLDVPATGRARMTVGGRPRGVADSAYDVETRTRTISTGPVPTTARVRVSLLR